MRDGFRRIGSGIIQMANRHAVPFPRLFPMSVKHTCLLVDGQEALLPVPDGSGGSRWIHSSTNGRPRSRSCRFGPSFELRDDWVQPTEVWGVTVGDNKGRPPSLWPLA